MGRQHSAHRLAQPWETVGAFTFNSNGLACIIAYSYLCLSIPVCLLVNVGFDSSLSPKIVGESHKTLLVFWAWSFPLPGVHMMPGLN